MSIINKLERNRFLNKLTTIGVGGPADYFAEVHDIEEMQTLLLFCREQQLPYFILGKGSNLIFDDRGFAGVVIANRIQFLNKPEENLWHVGAGYSFSLLGSQTARKNFSGLEFASGIPGSVGGAVFMNAGANGHETSQFLDSVDFVTEEGEFICLSKEQLTFDYRSSCFQEKKGAIVGATFRLISSDVARQKQLDIIHYRTKTQPYDAKSAGCAFRNPAGKAAGALIDQIGLKGKQLGGAQVSPLHANFIVNTGMASSSDILNLMQVIRQEVKNHTGLELEDEVRYIPYQP